VLLGRGPDALLHNDNGAIKRLADAPPPPIPPAGLPSSLLERRPDVRVAEANLVAVNAEVGVAGASLYPSIMLTASGGVTSTARRAGERAETLSHPAVPEEHPDRLPGGLRRPDRPREVRRVSGRPAVAGRRRAHRHHDCPGPLPGRLLLLFQPHRRRPRPVHRRAVPLGRAPEYPAVHGATVSRPRRGLAGRSCARARRGGRAETGLLSMRRPAAGCPTIPGRTPVPALGRRPRGQPARAPAPKWLRT
jgi:hypothetical protein